MASEELGAVRSEEGVCCVADVGSIYLSVAILILAQEKVLFSIANTPPTAPCFAEKEQQGGHACPGR